MIATAAQLSSECSDEALLQLSTEIAGYDRYKLRLGLSDAKIDAIDKCPSMVDNIPGRFLAALKMWKSKSILEMYPLNSTATYDRLVEIASEIEDGEAVRSIHKACVEHTCELQMYLVYDHLTITFVSLLVSTVVPCNSELYNYSKNSIPSVCNTHCQNGIGYILQV